MCLFDHLGPFGPATVGRAHLKRLLGLAAVVTAMGATASTALAYGPGAQPGDPAGDACNAAVERQIAAGIQAGGGPKSVDVGPANCDHFWQRPTRQDPIGDGWPPPPFQP
jgi:hypothetical protein